MFLSDYVGPIDAMPHDATNQEIDDEARVGDLRGLSRRATLFVLGSVLFCVASLIFTIEAFVVERIPVLTESGLTAAKKLWLAKGPVSYDMDIELRGAQPGSVHVNVRNRVVAAETRDGRVPLEHTWETWSVPGMFETLQMDMETAENPEQTIQAAPGTKWQLRSEFDPAFGFPRRYHRMVTSGPEVYWRVTRFESR